MIVLSIALGVAFSIALLSLRDVLPHVFTQDAAVLAQCALLWPVLALVQPLSGAVFALDGILIGASDVRFIAGSMAVAFVACAGRSRSSSGATSACVARGWRSRCSSPRAPRRWGRGSPGGAGS